MAALDCVSENSGRRNFEEMTSLVMEIKKKSKNYYHNICDEITRLIKVVQEFGKRDLKTIDHFGCGAGGCHAADGGPACHCAWFVFGRRDPATTTICDINSSSEKEVTEGAELCGHIHSGNCAPCNEMVTLHMSCKSLVTSMQQHADLSIYCSEEIQRFDYLASNYWHYIGHQYRLIHEDYRRKFQEEECKNDPSRIMVVADFAMKFLPLRYRESMSEWFGKKGITWHGIWISWWDPTKSKFVGYRVNQISGDSIEDSEAVSQYLTATCEGIPPTFTWFTEH